MATLLLCCAGPMQSWGTKSRFEKRDTEREPSKSGIIGLICAALGRDRKKPLDDLASLRMGLRVDSPGRVEVDFHTAIDVIKAKGKDTGTQLSERAYLADALFLVGLEGDDPRFLTMIHNQLKNPVWPLFLGRKSFPPSPPIYLPNGLFKKNTRLLDVLKTYPCLPGASKEKFFQLVLECNSDDYSEERWDQPVSFEIDNRKFHNRFVKKEWIPRPEDVL
jgi:CRISPR system Cascade subunit CasD